jgi:hypothetical protein
MATDYDAPRLREGEEDKAESLEELRSTGTRTAVDLLEEDTEAVDGHTLPGADLSGLQLEVTVLPRQADEFSCISCFLLCHRSQESKPGTGICSDCA